ncbi:MAG TPA: NYN domain-containing protein [Candidatus Binatia bacterium]|nr:NYN domain-containing protein [Candidatus Binatia bacterium]
MKRHAVFVDAGYVFAQGSVSLLGNKSPRTQLKLDLDEVIAQLKSLALGQSPGVTLLRIYWYDGAWNGPTVEHLAIANMPDVKLRLGSINSAGEQKEVDSLLVTDLIDLARNQSICDATIVTADTDVRIAVQIAQTFGVRVHLVGLEPSRVSQSPALRQEVDTVCEISKADVAKFLAVAAATPTKVYGGPGNPSPPSLGTTPKTASVKSVSQVIEEAIKRTAGARSAQDIAQLKAALAGSPTVPTEYDRLLLANCRTLLQRDLTGEERREMRSAFKKAILAL